MGNNPSDLSPSGKCKDKVAGQDTKRFPVDSVSWGEAAEFCWKLSEMPVEKRAGHGYRLPTEAQWEYACRAGSMGRFCFSSGRGTVPKEHEENALKDYAWFQVNSGGMPHAVGLKRANAWGLFDMHGNVSEICQDWYDKNCYAKSAADDPSGPSDGRGRVGRGGTWDSDSGQCRSATRAYSEPPEKRWTSGGFRVALALVEE